MFLNALRFRSTPSEPWQAWRFRPGQVSLRNTVTICSTTNDQNKLVEALTLVFGPDQDGAISAAVSAQLASDSGDIYFLHRDAKGLKILKGREDLSVLGLKKSDLWRQLLGCEPGTLDLAENPITVGRLSLLGTKLHSRAVALNSSFETQSSAPTSVPNFETGLALKRHDLWASLPEYLRSPRPPSEAVSQHSAAGQANVSADLMEHHHLEQHGAAGHQSGLGAFEPGQLYRFKDELTALFHQYQEASRRLVDLDQLSETNGGDKQKSEQDLGHLQREINLLRQIDDLSKPLLEPNFNLGRLSNRLADLDNRLTASMKVLDGGQCHSQLVKEDPATQAKTVTATNLKPTDPSFKNATATSSSIPSTVLRPAHGGAAPIYAVDPVEVDWTLATQTLARLECYGRLVKSTGTIKQHFDKCTTPVIDQFFHGVQSVSVDRAQMLAELESCLASLRLACLEYEEDFGSQEAEAMVEDSLQNPDPRTKLPGNSGLRTWFDKFRQAVGTDLGRDDQDQQGRSIGLQSDASNKVRRETNRNLPERLETARLATEQIVSHLNSILSNQEGRQESVVGHHQQAKKQLTKIYLELRTNYERLGQYWVEVSRQYGLPKSLTLRDLAQVMACHTELFTLNKQRQEVAERLLDAKGRLEKIKALIVKWRALAGSQRISSIESSNDVMAEAKHLRNYLGARSSQLDKANRTKAHNDLLRGWQTEQSVRIAGLEESWRQLFASYGLTPQPIEQHVIMELDRHISFFAIEALLLPTQLLPTQLQSNIDTSIETSAIAAHGGDGMVRALLLDFGRATQAPAAPHDMGPVNSAMAELISACKDRGQLGFTLVATSCPNQHRQLLKQGFGEAHTVPSQPSPGQLSSGQLSSRPPQTGLAEGSGLSRRPIDRSMLTTGRGNHPRVLTPAQQTLRDSLTADAESQKNPRRPNSPSLLNPKAQEALALFAKRRP